MNLGKITKIYFGIGGFDEGQFGLYIEIKTKDEELTYAGDKVWNNFGSEDHMKPSKCFNMVKDIAILMEQAEVRTSSELIGKPVTFEKDINWWVKNVRILTEVI